MNQKITRKLGLLALCIAIAFIIYSGISLWAGIPNLSNLFAPFPTAKIIQILLISIFAYICRFLAWQINLKYLGAKVPLIFSLQCYFAGYLFLPTPARAGTSIRALYLNRYVPYSTGLIALFLERINDLIATLIFTLFFVKVINSWLFLILLTIIILSISGRTKKLSKATASSKNFVNSLKLLGKRLIPPFLYQKIEGLYKGIGETLKTKPSFFKSKAFICSQLLFCVAYISYGLVLYTALSCLNIDISAFHIISIYSVSVFVGSLSFLPVGLGGAEAIIILLLSLESISRVDAVAVTLISRLCTIWFIILIGLVATLTLLINQQKPESNH